MIKEEIVEAEPKSPVYAVGPKLMGKNPFLMKSGLELPGGFDSASYAELLRLVLPDEADVEDEEDKMYIDLLQQLSFWIEDNFY